MNRKHYLVIASVVILLFFCGLIFLYQRYYYQDNLSEKDDTIAELNAKIEGLEDKINGILLDRNLDEQCMVEPVQGPCEALIYKFYYDIDDGECKQFLWGGCDGVVPFETMENCEETCL